MKYADVTTNQKLAFWLGLAAALLYWYHLLLLTQARIDVQQDQLIGLGFGLLIAILSWFRFVLTTSHSFKSGP